MQRLKNTAEIASDDRRQTEQYEFLDRASQVRILSAPPQFSRICGRGHSPVPATTPVTTPIAAGSKKIAAHSPDMRICLG